MLNKNKSVWGAEKPQQRTKAGLLAWPLRALRLQMSAELSAVFQVQSEMERHMGGLAYNRTWRCTVLRGASIDPPPLLSLPLPPRPLSNVG